MRRRLIRITLILLLFPPFLAALAGWLVGPAYLHPIRRELTPDLIREADASFALSGGHREDFNVRAPDGVMCSAAGKFPRLSPTAAGSSSFTASPITASASSAKPNFF